jgi:transcriptional regulator with XRE-family HTH domain
MENEKEKYIFIGSRVREARQKKGLSQKDLAERLNFESATSISLIEAGERKISIYDLERAADVLNEDIAYFLGEQKVKVAFRADGLGKEDTEAIQHIIEMAKRHARGK